MLLERGAAWELRPIAEFIEGSANAMRDVPVILRSFHFHNQTSTLHCKFALNILVVEDEPELASAPVRGLEEAEFCLQLSTASPISNFSANSAAI
jgi:hypothetical protein